MLMFLPTYKTLFENVIIVLPTTILLTIGYPPYVSLFETFVTN